MVSSDRLLHSSASTWLIPALMLLVGLAGSYWISDAFRRDAVLAWEAEAEQAGARLSSILLTWLEESYNPVSALGALIENTDSLDEVAFLNSMDSLEARSTAFFLDSAAYARAEVGQAPGLVFSTDISGPLAAESSQPLAEELVATLNAAIDQPDRVLLGIPFADQSDELLLPVALAIYGSDDRSSVVLGLVSLDSIVEGLFEQLVPAGVELELSGSFLGEPAHTVYPHDASAESRYIAETRTLTGEADIAVRWHMSSEFANGPRLRAADLALIAGCVISLILSLFIGMLLRRNQLISLRIQEATAALARSRDAADAANQAKSAFLANMSHELRTPMNAIIGYSEMLMEDAEDRDDDVAREDLSKIHRSGSHLLDLINDVLDLSKIEAGKVELNPVTFDIAQVVDSAVTTAATMVAKNGNTLSVDISNELSQLHSDPTRVRQMLLNLMSNAAKFTHSGTISLSVEPVSDDTGDWLQMAVADTGIGIEPAKIEHVFGEFTQADETTTRDYGGTGLGLSISRRYARLLGGDITVTSEIGKGSTFNLRLPLTTDTTAPSRIAESSSSTSAPSPAGETTILVVDDDPQAVELLSRTLQNAGMRVVTASRGQEALALAQQLQPSAITLDVLLPEMDGWEILRKLKANPSTRDIPVIMVTMTDDQKLGMALGATEFLNKPVQKDRLLDILSRHVGSEVRTALVVDDLEDNRVLLRNMLEKEGWQVQEAENGKVALDAIEDGAPGVVLLDLMMPVMDGFEFVGHMRKLDPTGSIPIVVITAKDVSDQDRQRLLGSVSGLIERHGQGLEALLERIRDEVLRSESQ